MARKTRSVKGAVKYFKRPYILHMKEGKPTVYKIQLCRGRVIKEDDFIAYAAQAAHVPESTMKTAKHAIFAAINYFVLNGHAVELAGLGSFSPRILSKTTDNPEDVTAELIRRKYIRFNPSADIQSLCAAENISFEENKTLTKQYMNQYVFRIRKAENGEKYLVTMDGKLVVNEDGQCFFYDDVSLDETARGWYAEDADQSLVSAWGSVTVDVAYKSEPIEGQNRQMETYVITSGVGEVKISKHEDYGGVMSPIPFAYVAEEA